MPIDAGKPMLRWLLALALLTGGGGFAAAGPKCPAVGGKVVLDDVFKDGNGGWPVDTSATFNSGLILKLGGEERDWVYVNDVVSARDADYCAEVVVPEKESLATGLALLYVDDENYTRLQIYGDKTIQLARVVDGDWTDYLNAENPKVQPAAGSVVAVRAVLHNGVLTAYVDGVEVKSTPLKLPEGAFKLGVVAVNDKPSGAVEPFAFNAVRVAIGP